MQSNPLPGEALSQLLGGGAAGILIIVVLTSLFILWAMWVLFPLVVYFQLRAVQRHLQQLHGDLVETNIRLAERNDTTQG